MSSSRAVSCDKVNLAGAALHFWQFLERRFRGRAHCRRFAAGGGDQPRGKTFLIVDQNLEQMFGREFLSGRSAAADPAPTE